MQNTKFKFVFSLLFLIALGTNMAQGQSEELKQHSAAFKADQEKDYDLKYLNISDRDFGAIDDIEMEWKDEFMLKSKEKAMNNLGSNAYQKFYFSIYSFETLEDRQYALKDWLKDFIGGETIRAGRDMRTYPYGTPTIILINDLEIIVCNYKCADYTEENFEDWQDRLLQYFGADNTMVIEIGCDGPLRWTKNAPDPKDARKLF